LPDLSPSEAPDSFAALVDAVDARAAIDAVAPAAPVASAPVDAAGFDFGAGEDEDDDDDGGTAVAPSPGANARESLLVATWRAWLHHPITSRDDELDELLTALAATTGATDIAGAADAAAVQRLVGAGPRALPALARAFPGVLAHHPFEGSAVIGVEPSTFFQVLMRLGADAVAPILVGELDSTDRLHRWGAIYGLSLLDVPAAMPRLAQRAFDSESRLAILAVQVLLQQRQRSRSLAVASDPALADRRESDFSTVLLRLRDLCRRGDDFERQRSVRALAALRDPGSVNPLIDLLGARPKEIAEEARTALIEITGQDFGTAERRWRAWLADNADKPRRAWLVDSLGHREAALRRTAAEELRDEGVALFDYRADAPLREREASLVAIRRSTSTLDLSGDL